MGQGQGNYDNTNRGALFKNHEKQKETHSDYNGNLNVEGTDYYLNAWLKKDRNGKSYMSLSVKPKNGGNSRGGSRGNGNSGGRQTQDDDFPDDFR